MHYKSHYSRQAIPRLKSFLAGLGMTCFSILTIKHFFLANYPESIFEGSFCDISAFFNCDSSAFSAISQIAGIPLGYFGVILGALVMLGSVFPSENFEKTNAFLLFANGVGVIALLIYSLFFLKSLCLLCSGFYLFSIISLILFWNFRAKENEKTFIEKFFRPSFKILITIFLITAVGAYGIIEYHNARKKLLSADSSRMVKQFFNLPIVNNPSFISPFWTVRSTNNFEDAPIRIIEFSDFTCPDCLFLTNQLNQLKEEFQGKINIAFQFFPLEGDCNNVVEKDIHPGACELAYIAAADPAQFHVIHDEIFLNFNLARSSSEWRKDLARRYGVQDIYQNPSVKTMIETIINTGMEYEKTSDQFSFGIRSTPTMIINGRLVIGTFPIEQMRAIFKALIEEKDKDNSFMENWIPPEKQN